MSDVTLEQIADGQMRDFGVDDHAVLVLLDGACEVLAREVIALRNQAASVYALNGVYARLDSLENDVRLIGGEGEDVDALEAGRADGEPKGSWHPLGVWQPPNPAAEYERARADGLERDNAQLAERLARAEVALRRIVLGSERLYSTEVRDIAQQALDGDAQ